MSHASYPGTNPDSPPKGSPDQRYSEETTNLIFVIQSVTDQSKALGTVTAEVCSLKESVKEHSGVLRDVRDKNIEFGLKISAVEQSAQRVSDELKVGMSEIKSLIEKHSAKYDESLKKTETNIIDKLVKMETDKVAKLEQSVESLKKFSWAFYGGTTVIGIVLMVIRFWPKA